MRHHEVIENRTAFATATLNTEIQPPGWARSALFHWRISAVAGTTPIADCKLQSRDPTSAQVIDIDGAAFGQKLAASFQNLMIGPGVIADATGDYRACQATIGTSMRAAFVFDRTTGDETYTFTLTVDWMS